MIATSILVALVATIPFSLAQFPPPAQYSNVLRSSLNSNISVAYTSPTPGTCTTVFSTQKQYTGYISIPPFTLAPIQQNYSINTFFWFVEARINPESAPLTIYLNGGPGSSSMFGLFQETGPCEVVEMPDGSYGTEARMWGWDRSSNVIFIDQPDQVGFSYDSLTNASYNLINGTTTYPPSQVPDGQPDYTFLNGTFGTGKQYATPNTTDIAAHATWHFLQTWLATFPQYNPATKMNSTQTNGTTGIHLFAESYGGKYGPVFAKFFEQQNQALDNGLLPANSTLKIQLASLGIINGLIDDLIQDYYYPYFAYNNTYGIQAIPQVNQLNDISSYQQTCLPAINACRTALANTDPSGDGDVASTDSLCEKAQLACNELNYSYQDSDRDVYDVRIQNPSPYPPAAYQGYLNEASVQSAIGTQINYTESNSLIQQAFTSTGDTIRGVSTYDLADLLRMGVRVAMMYGDADYICNWMGGEAVSLALAGLLNTTSNSTNLTPTSTTSSPESAATPPIGSVVGAPGSYASGFPSAGYADIVVNSSYVGGAVRQYGNLSFSRVYDAGHFVPFFQPETAFTIFTRVILGTDISTGEVINLTNFSSTGPANSTHTNSPYSSQPSPTCWIRDMASSCSQDKIQSIAAGQGVVEAGVWYANSKDYSPPTSTVVAGVPGTPVSSSSTTGKGSSSSVPVTGVYTATGTPTSKGLAVAMKTAAPELLGGTLALGLLMGAIV